MVLITGVRVDHFTVWSGEREGGRRGELIENAHASRLPDKKSGEFQRERKVQKREGWEGKVLVGVTENRRCNDSGQRRRRLG